MRKKNIYGLGHKGERTWERTFCEGHMGNMVRAHEQDHMGKKHGLANGQGNIGKSTWARACVHGPMRKGQGQGHTGKSIWTLTFG